jgi:D-arginine dehydrogenase
VYKRSVDALPASCDVAVIGGGFAGAATAWWIARTCGASVAVLEREDRPGKHASGRGAGLGRQVTEDDATTALAVRGARWLRNALPGPWPAGPPWIASGSFLTFADEGAMTAHLARAARFGVACEAVDVARVVARWPGLAGMPARGALWFPDDGLIRVRALLDGLLAGARAAGARLVVGCAVGDARPSAAGSGASVELDTAKGPIRARVVVDAAGAWAGELARRWGAGDGGLVPWKRHLAIVGAAAPAADAPFVWHVAPGELYARPDALGTLVSPCDATPSTPHDPAADPDAALRVHVRLRVSAPELAIAPVVRTWACLRTFTPDRAPRVGADPEHPWLVWVAGLGGHGATAAMAIGEDGAAVVTKLLA